MATPAPPPQARLEEDSGIQLELQVEVPGTTARPAAATVAEGKPDTPKPTAGRPVGGTRSEMEAPGSYVETGPVSTSEE